MPADRPPEDRRLVPASSYSRAPYYADWRRRYDVVAKIGSGGFADVYEAYDAELGREVALKVVDEGRTVAGRVLREVEAARALDHPNIVALYDFFADQQRSFLVWELVRGQSFAELVGDLDDDEAVLAAAQLFDALAYAHAKGVVHRDVKPQNVMIDGHGAVKVMDFGIARLIDADTLTAEGEMLGTVAYMSPEQAGGRRVGPPTDVYSAGLLLYELLAGENPVRGASAGETVSNILAGRVTPLERCRPDLPQELCDLVARACALRAIDRPAPFDLAGALRGLAGRLGGRRLRPQRLLAPFRRLEVVAECGLGALLAAASILALVTRLPAYPSSWALPLAAIGAGAWLVAPRLGLAWTLGALAFPLFDVSWSAGASYLLVAVIAFVAFRRRPLFCVWPAIAVLLAPIYGALLAPWGGGGFGRPRGPPVGPWFSIVTYVVTSLAAHARSPFAGFGAPGRLEAHLRAAGDPVTVLRAGLDAVLSWPCLLQAAVWAGLALALAVALRLDRLELRLWIWAGSFSIVYVIYRAVPVAVWHRPATAHDVLLDVVVAATASGVALAFVGSSRPAPSVEDALLDDA
jgi:Protein kinase domain